MSTRMNTPQNNFGFCAVLRAARLRVLSGFIAMLCASHTAFALDINQANEAELDSLKGMGPALSAKVLKARAQGSFKSWPDLMQRVSGIRQNKAHKFSEQGLTVNGQAFDAKP